MAEKTLNNWNYVVLVLGLTLILLALPLVDVFLGTYGPDIYATLHRLGIPVEISLFLEVLLTLLLGLIGFSLWRSQRELWSQVTQRTEKNNVHRTLSLIQRIYGSLVLLIAAISPLAYLGTLALLFLMFMLSRYNYPPTGMEEIALNVSQLLQVGLTLGEFVLAFRIARIHWRLLRGTPVNTELAQS